MCKSNIWVSSGHRALCVLHIQSSLRDGLYRLQSRSDAGAENRGLFTALFVGLNPLGCASYNGRFILVIRDRDLVSAECVEAVVQRKLFKSCALFLM